MQSTCYSCPILMKLEISRQVKKHSNTKFHKIPSSEAELFHADGQREGEIDKRTGMTKLIFTF
jgi:hypothetical protein